jgi:hypothetical protein
MAVKGGSLRVNAWWTRKDLDSVEKGLTATGEKKGWTLVSSGRKAVALTEATLFVFDVPTADKKLVMRNAFCVIVGEGTTHMLHFGAPKESLDQALLDRVIESFHFVDRVPLEGDAPKAAPKKPKPAIALPEVSAPAAPSAEPAPQAPSQGGGAEDPEEPGR